MTPEQLSELLVGIARTQAAVIEALERLDKSPMPAVRQEVRNSLCGLLNAGQEARPISLETLPAHLLEAALAPSSHAGQVIRRTAADNLKRLLKD